MRKHLIIPTKTTDFTQIIKHAKQLIKDGMNPSDVLHRMNEEYFKPIGIRYHIESDTYQKKFVPSITEQQDEQVKPKETFVWNESAGNKIESKSAETIEDSNEPTNEFTRIVFVCNRTSRDHKIQAASEANGLVVNYYTWDVFSYPPAALSFNMSDETIIKHLSDKTYTIYHVDFGTIVTLYYYNKKWRISSANGYEVDDKIWIGQYTFKQVVNDVFVKYGIDTTSLNTEWCYSFGFHHPEYHPFDGAGQQPIRAWFIRAVNIKTFNTSFEFTSADNYVIGHKIPMQRQAVEINTLAAVDARSALTTMHDLCKKSYAKYIHDKTSTPIYGFVLLSNAPEVIANVLIESELQKKLRKFICRRPPNYLVPEKRLNWMMINASMDKIEDRSEFRQMFPQTKDSGDKFDKLISDLASKIVNLFNKEKHEFADTQFDHIVKFIIGKMKEQKNYVNRLPESIGTVQDYLYSSSFAYLYATII